MYGFPVPISKEDRIKLQVYSGIDKEDVSEYTRECMRAFNGFIPENYNPLKEISGTKYTLEEILFQLALDYFSAESVQEKREIDKRAFGKIKMCCGRFKSMFKKVRLSFAKKYVGLYREFKKGKFYVYVE